ncbi:MAG: hypothetical protein H6737_03140 [Alphaproteobacteria bacterium]|nr:hypothetical protein [Alphaproteobacteria bacterium]
MTARRLALWISGAWLLACSGLGGSQGTKPGVKVNPDREDPAEIARLSREYSVAEAILKDRIRKNPEDHHAHRLLGDVNLMRGQDYQKKWKENLARAFDSYAQAVSLQPKNCSYWSRLASVVAMSYPNDQTRIPRTSLERLPTDIGWENCASAAMLEVELGKDATPQEFEAAEKATKSVWDALNMAAPWLQDAFARVPLDHVSWTEGPGDAELRAGGPFVVLDPPLTAKGQGHGYDRPVSGIELFTLGRQSEGKVIFTDKKFPEKIPAEAIVMAPACKHTAWKDNGPDGVPTGTCSTSTFIRGQSPLYNPSILKIAGPAHYSHPSIKPATIPAEEIMWESVKCVGGKVQRKLEYTPTCPVTYDKPNWLTRWLPRDKVHGAADDLHAQQMMNAAGMKVIWGDELSERMVRGDVGIGMPYGLFKYALPNLKGCQGRALLSLHYINGGELEWNCALGDTAYTFVDLQLVWVGPATELGTEHNTAVTDDDE